MSVSIRHAFAATAAVAALLTTPAVFADAAYHPKPTEAGATFNPDHVTQKSREQVNAELNAARSLPGWDRISRFGAAWPAANGPGLTRAEVNADLQAAMSNPAWDRVSRIGAAWPANQSAAARAASTK